MSPMTAEQILDREFLELRAKLLELAASLDRLARAEGTLANDPRLDGLRDALQILLDADAQRADRAEQIQLIFSRPYDPDWRSALRVTS
jgi:hypothetical protein